MNDQHVLKLLHDEITKAGGKKTWADKHGIKPSHVSDMLAGRRTLSPAVGAALGLVARPREWIYVEAAGVTT